MSAILVLSLSFFNGCDSDETIPINPVVQQTYMSFTNASPDAPNVDVYVAGSLAQANISFRGTMNYKSFLPGSSQVTVYVNGTTTNPLIDTTVSMSVNNYYSIFAVDSLQSIRPLILNDNLSTPGSLNCNARFLNLSPNAPSYDVRAEGKTQAWFPDFSFGQFSSFRALTAGLYNLEVTLQSTSTVVQTVNNVALQQGYIYTFFTGGFVGPLGAPPAPTFTIITNFPFLNP